MAARPSLASCFRPVSRNITRTMSSASDRATASQAFGALGGDVFDAPVEEAEVKPFMLLPRLGAHGRGARRDPLINVPPPEDPLLHFLSSMIMRHGERAKSSRTVSRTLLHIYTLTRAPPLPILREAVLLSSPAVKTQTRSHGAKVVHTPMALSEKQRTHSGIKWLLDACKTRAGRRLEERLAREIVDVVQRVYAARDKRADDVQWTGALGKKQEAHRLAMVNRGGVRIAPGAAKTFAALSA
ncbi:ribosomal protein S7 domain-containing protein [Mycena pura]|uniref:Ribosomal protein S7 domain-containing protein n=1 Tax=Mycena pura TaxID=153505 RepID=A0AAD6UQR9_9AGAR|nr:ribosomal protein S7 domain-containing protein [Mycena pura]